jgi:hypothetical protein
MELDDGLYIKDIEWGVSSNSAAHGNLENTVDFIHAELDPVSLSTI